MFIAPYDDPYVVAGQVRFPVIAPRCLAFISSLRAVRGCRSSGRCLCCPIPATVCEDSVHASNAHLQGTIGNEILRETDMDKLDAIFVAVGEL